MGLTKQEKTLENEQKRIETNASEASCYETLFSTRATIHEWFWTAREQVMYYMTRQRGAWLKYGYIVRLIACYFKHFGLHILKLKQLLNGHKINGRNITSRTCHDACFDHEND